MTALCLLCLSLSYTQFNIGVSAWDSKHNKPGKKHPTSPEPGAPSPEVPTPQEQKKRRTGGGAHSSRSKKQRLVCILVPLVILAVLGGIAAAIGITMTQQKQHAQARAATKAAAQPAPARTTPGPPLAFKVNVTVPPDEKGKPGPTCAGLFGPQGDKARLEVGGAVLEAAHDTAFQSGL